MEDGHGRLEDAIKTMFRAQGRTQEADDDRSCFVLTDLDGMIVMASAAWYRVWQLTPGQALGQRTSILNGSGHDARACSTMGRSVAALMADGDKLHTPSARMVNSRRGGFRFSRAAPPPFRAAMPSAVLGSAATAVVA